MEEILSIPEIKWAQRRDKIFLRIEVFNLKDFKLDIQNEGKISFK